jgi:hypothetical protein
VSAADKIALDEASARARNAWTDNLSTSPWIVDGAVVVKIVNELAAFDRHKLEISLRSALEITLDQRRTGSWNGRDRLTSSPRVCDISVVVKIMDEIGSFANHDFKIAVVPTSEVALNDDGPTCGGRVDALCAPPRIGDISIVVKVMNERLAF